jgi:glycosyltransferase involved in cell wall biosynthesis
MHSDKSMESAKPKSIYFTVVIPLFNEQESLQELYEQLSKVSCLSEKPTEFIFVDDGSTDQSINVLTRLHEQDPRVRVIQFRRNYGKSAALAIGFEKAHGKIIITLDADLQDDPGEISRLVGTLDEGNDLVCGWRKDRKDPVLKKASSKLFNRVTSLLTGIRIHDVNCGLKAFRREVIHNIKVYGKLHRFLPILAKSQGFKVGEVVVKHNPRLYGRTKYGVSRFAEGFFDLITVLFITRFTKKPLHIFGSIGIFSLTLGVAISAYLTIEKLFLGRFLSSRPLLFLGILLIIVGIQFFSIGLLGEMLTESRKDHNAYSIKKVLG